MSVLVLRPISTYLRNVKVRNSLQLLHQANRKNVFLFRILQRPIFKPIMSLRNLSTSHITPENEENEVAEREGEEDEEGNVDSEEEFIKKYF